MTTPSSQAMSFELLVTAIGQAHAELAAQAARAVNTGLTARNWLIGFYIEEYERHGVDRQQYGDKLLDRLAETLERKGAFRRDRRELYRYRQFYLTYPQIVETLSPQLIVRLGASSPGPKRGIVESASPQSEISASPLRDALPSELDIPPQRLMQSLSFSHFAELILLKEPLKRRFYEVECLRGNWSVRELKRQIASLYYERSGLSSDKNKLADHVQGQAEKSSIGLSVRDPYVFEFLGLKPQEVMYETDVEDALLDNLQEFLPELGHGFCFEARQKRILIGDSHNFVDLVFYHRILKCHVLVELKVAAFSHENIGQLNTYVSWYRKHMMTEGDNPPVGILLCTQKDHALVEYGLAGIDNGLFVSKYLLELPKKEEMQRFIEEQLAAGAAGQTNIRHMAGGESKPGKEDRRCRADVRDRPPATAPRRRRRAGAVPTSSRRCRSRASWRSISGCCRCSPRRARDGNEAQSVAA